MVNNIPVTGATASIAMPAWPEAGYPTGTGPVPINIADAFVYVTSQPETSQWQLTVSFQTDGMDGSCSIGATVMFPAGQSGTQTIALSPTGGSTAVLNCATTRITSYVPQAGTGRIAASVRPTSDTTGTVTVTMDLDFQVLAAVDGRPNYIGTADVQGSVNVELRRDGSALSNGALFKSPTGSGGGAAATQFGLPSGVSSLSCSSPLPAGYQCLTNSGGTVPAKFNVTTFTNQWWVNNSAQVCIFWSRSTGRATLRAYTGMGGGVVTQQARFGVLVRANGTPIPDNNNWYIASIPEPGYSWDPQWQLLTFQPTGSGQWLGQSLQRTSICPW